MAGLLAFDNRSRAQMPIQQSYRRKPSINAKYDRILGNSQSIRTGRGSIRTLAEVGARFDSRSDEKQTTKKKDDLEIYRKLGVKMPQTATGRDLNGGSGVMVNLDRYRLGNIPPPKSNTPPRLNEKLRKILYPSPPPPPLTESTPPLPELLSDPQQSGQNHARSFQDRPPPMSPYDLAPPHQAMATRVQGWIYTPLNGWVYIPPPPSPNQPNGGQSLPIPPPPPLFQDFTSPYSASSQPDQYNLTNQQSSRLYEYNNYSDSIDNQEQAFPKSILRNSGSSDSGQGHRRSVKFRDTPDFAYPKKFAQEREDVEDEIPEVGICDPPRWTLRKSTQGKGNLQRQYQARNRLNDGETAFASPAQPPRSRLNTSRITVDQRTKYRDEPGNDSRSRQSDMPTNAARETSRISTVPPLLANAHQQLLAGHGVAPQVSGKRSGRALIQNLESIAEIQLEAGANGSAYSRDMPHQEYDTDEQSQSRGPILDRSQPTSNDGYGNPDMTLLRSPHAIGRLSPSQPDWRDGQGHHPQQDNKRQLDGECRRKAHSTPTIIRRRDPTSVPSSLLHELQENRENNIKEGPNDQPRRVMLYQSRSVPTTPHRQTSTNGRLPPPSQNWRESQRPIMSVPEIESFNSQSQSQPQSQSQIFGSQTSIRSRGQEYSEADKNSRSVLKGRQQGLEWQEDSEEVKTPPRSKEQYHYSLSNARQSLSRAQLTSHEDRLPPPSQSHSQTPNQNQSQGKSSMKRARETSIPPRSSSSVTVSPPHLSQRQRQRHRLNGSQPVDPDDPTDITYQPHSPSSPEDEDREEDEQDQSVFTNWEDEDEDEDEEDSIHGGKRMKITEGAWAKYDIPQNLLPPPPPPLPTPKTPQSRLNPRPTLTRFLRLTPLKSEFGLKSSQSQSQSQISQIENPDEEDEESWWDDIEESFSLSQGNHSDVGGKGRGNSRLSTIDEEDEEVEKEVEDARMGQKEWVEKGFFQNGGEVGFTVWRDQY